MAARSTRQRQMDGLPAGAKAAAAAQRTKESSAAANPGNHTAHFLSTGELLWFRAQAEAIGSLCNVTLAEMGRCQTSANIIDDLQPYDSIQRRQRISGNAVHNFREPDLYTQATRNGMENPSIFRTSLVLAREGCRQNKASAEQREATANKGDGTRQRNSDLAKTDKEETRSSMTYPVSFSPGTVHSCQRSDRWNATGDSYDQ